MRFEDLTGRWAALPFLVLPARMPHKPNAGRRHHIRNMSFKVQNWPAHEQACGGVVAWQKRDRERVTAPVFSESHRSKRAQPECSSSDSAGPQHQAAQDLWLDDIGRSV